MAPCQEFGYWQGNRNTLARSRSLGKRNGFVEAFLARKLAGGFGQIRAPFASADVVHVGHSEFGLIILDSLQVARPRIMLAGH